MIVKCATCGTHVPPATMVEVTRAGETQRFCSARCADQSAREPLPELPELPRRLLVAVDGSGPSVRAVEDAAALAVATGAKVQLLLAIDTAALRPLGIQPRSGTQAEAPSQPRVARAPSQEREPSRRGREEQRSRAGSGAISGQSSHWHAVGSP